jgi:5-methylcytosine-specific restriction protein A
MPSLPKRPCPGRGPRYHRCPNLISSGEQCCPQCLPFVKKVQREYDKERDQTEERQWIHSTRWRKASKLFLDQHSLCTECERQERLTPAYLVDHIEPHCGSYEKFWNEENWQGLCNACHEEKHKGERWGR